MSGADCTGGRTEWGGRRWGLTGGFLSLAGSVFLAAGLLICFVGGIQGWMLLWGGSFCAIGVLALLYGISVIAWGHRLKIRLTRDAVMVGGILFSDTVYYADIRNVRFSTDNDIVLEMKDGRTNAILYSYFDSALERREFFEALGQRLPQAESNLGHNGAEAR